MCNPALWAAAAAAIGAAATAVTSDQNAKNTAAQQEDAFQQTADAAKAAAGADYQQLTLQQQQVDAASNEEQYLRMQQALRERAAIRVGAGEAGLSGIGREEQGSYMSESHDLAILEANKKGTMAQLQTEKEAVRARAQERIAAATPIFPSRTNWGLAGLQIGASALAAGASAGGGKSSAKK